MHVCTFHLSLTLPRDPRFADTARDLAVQAAKQAGCTDIDAQKFGRRVEGTIRECLGRGEARETLPVVVRCNEGPVEVLVDGHTLAVKA
jgi:hypothetical protein